MAISEKNRSQKTHIVKSQAELETLLAGSTVADGDIIEFNGVSVTCFKGAGAPTTSTVAFSIGDVYFDTTNAVFYDCTGISVASNVYTFTWTVRPKGVSINGTAITPTNGVYNIPNASVSESGVIKTGASFNTNVLSSGYMQAVTNTYEQYQSKGNDAFVGKGTLENVLDNESVRFDKATSLTDAQKTQGRANIGAFGAEPYVEGGTYVEGIFYYVPEE